MKVTLNEDEVSTVLYWFSACENEAGTYLSDVSLLLKLGVKPEQISVTNSWKKFYQDCSKCIYLGSIRTKYKGYEEGCVWPDIDDMSEKEKNKIRKRYKDSIEGRSEERMVNIDALVVEYEHHDIFFCTGVEKTLIMRYGSEGPEYTSGKPYILRQSLEEMKKQEPNFPLIKIYEKALELFNVSGIPEK